MDESIPRDGDVPADSYRTLVSAFPNGVLVLFDEDLRYRLVGPDVLPFSERNASEMVGKTIHDLFAEQYAADLEPELRATLDGSPRSFDMEYEEQIHHIETRPLTIDDESFGVLVTHEVTDERECTNDLKRKTRRLETVATLLSHDLRNPLNIALAHLDVLDDEVAGSHDSIAAIRRALTRMDTLMTDALALARETTLTDVQPVDIEHQATMAWQVVPAENATLQTEGSLHVMADPSLLANLVENLLQNAVAHGGSDVTVRVGPLDGRAGFYVEDDGPGVPPETRDSAFEVGVTTSEETIHSGMGLAIVREIADAHGWEVTLTEATSGGARIEVAGVTEAE